MTRETIGKTVVLHADNSAYITDGTVYTQTVYLGKDADEFVWRDATSEEYEEWQRQQEEPEPTPDEALISYANKLTGTNAETLQEATETLIKKVKGVAR